MKRLLVFVLIILTLLGAAACATAVPEGSSAPPAGLSASPAPAVETAAPTDQPAGGGDKDYGQIGFGLMKSETIGAVKIGMTESELLAAIGNPESESESQVWGADGKKHSDWIYKKLGLTVNMVESDNAESELAVYSITAEVPFTGATQRGVKLGDSGDAVIAAYGDAVEDQTEEGTKERIVAGSVFGGLIFGLEDGKVVSIFLGAAAE